jgi:RNA polymerase sigma factor (sigma-70 family)
MTTVSENERYKVDKYLAMMQDGDSSAMEALYEATAKPLYTLCYTYMRNHHDSEDALSETYLSVVRNIEKYRGRNGFNWLYTIAKNICLNMIRKNGRTVAVEATGMGYDRHYRIYGCTRLMSYAQYLLQHYFPHRQRIVEGEGEMMRRYLTGECSKELIEQIAAQGEEYTLRFLGKKPPVLPSAQTLATEERLRDIQRNGPQHKAGHFGSDVVNYQI